MAASTPMLTQGTGQPVLLLHSSLSSKIQWLSLMQMSTEYRWMAIDLLGYGQNALVAKDQPFSLVQEVAWIDEHLQQTDKIALVGHSYGGAVAMAWAMKHPTKVKQLILYEPVLFGLLDESDPGLQEIMSLIEVLNQTREDEGRWEQRTELFVNYWSGEGTFQRLPKVLQAEFVRVMPKVPLDFEAIRQLDFDLEAIADCGFRVHLILGMRSRVSSQSVVRALSLALPRCEVHELERAGHMGPLTHKEEVNQLMLSLIAP
jgi:pimeloyl-ACP methyl ester carboxylesterase